MKQEHEAFARAWGRIADACEEGLSDPLYPDDRRESLYRALASARAMAQPGALALLQMLRQPTLG